MTLEEWYVAAAMTGAVTGVISLVLTVFKIRQDAKIVRSFVRAIRSYERSVRSFQRAIRDVTEGKTNDASEELRKQDLEQRDRELEFNKIKTYGRWIRNYLVHLQKEE